MPTKPVKLYLNKALMQRDRSYISLLYPFFGPVIKKESPYESAAWRLHGFDKTYFKLVDDVHAADFYVVPHTYRWLAQTRPDVLDAMSKEAAAAGKPLLIDDTGDVHGPVPSAPSCLLRADGYRFLTEPDAVVVPLPAEDLLETYYAGRLAVREKSDVPSVGFVGWAQLPLRTRVKSYVKELPMRLRALSNSKYRAMEKGIFYRERALVSLARTKGIQTSLLSRQTFGGRIDTAGSTQWRKEFVDNLYDCDYALCVKGDANISFRFYEALSMGRIPLLLDTECVLPLQEKIDYRSFCVIVDYTDVDRIGEMVKKFHASCPPERFREMQLQARQTYEQFLRPDSFSPYLAAALHKQKAVAR